MARVAADASARALQYGPTEGMDELKDCIVQVMAEEGMDVGTDELLVTTGGQQVIDLVCKTLIDPGDVIVAEGPTYPGAVPTFGAYEADVVQIEMDADGMRVDLLEETLDRLEREGRDAEVHLHGADVPEPRRRDDGARAPPAARPDRRASASCSCSRTTRTACCATRATPLPPLYALDGGEYVIYLGTFSKILSPGLRLGWTAAPRPVLEKLNLGKQGADLLLVHVRAALRGRVLRAARLARRCSAPLRDLYRRRRDALLDALAEHFPAEADWTRPDGGLFIWATLPDYIDTTDLLARALREHVAFVPGRAAYLDGRGGSSMRLNFSGVGEDDLREGVRRIGKVVSEQVRLYSTLTGGAAPRRAARRRAAAAGRRRARVRASLPAAPARRRRAMSRVAVLAGGQSLERQVSLRSGARVRDALERLGHDVIAIDVGPDLVERLDRGARPTSPSSRCTAATARTARCRRSSSSSACPYTASGPSACMRCMDKVLAKHALRDAGLPTPDFYAFSQTAFESLGAAHALPGDRGAARLPRRRQARRAGLGARDPLRPDRRRGAGRDRRRVLLRHQGAARAPRGRARARRLRARRPRRARRRCRSSRRSRATATATTSRRATRSAARTSSVPPQLDAETTAARAGARARRLPRRSAATASRAST